MKRLKPITVSLCLCILAMVVESTKLAAQDGCPPATCPNGTHSVCHKECDPNVSPICSPKCVCRCEPDGNSLQMSQDKHAGDSAIGAEQVPANMKCYQQEFVNLNKTVEPLWSK